MSLARIKIDDENFTTLAFEALQKKRGFIITGLSADFTEAINNLYKSFDDFRKQPEMIKAPYKGESVGVSGYFSDEDYKFGAKTIQRFFTHRDADKKLTHVLPESLEGSDAKIGSYVEPIKDKIIKAIESGLQIKDGELANGKSESVMVLNHYLPTTQEKLQKMLKHSKLTVMKNGEIKAFEEHKDLVLFSMLIYRNNNTHGLKLKIPNENNKKVYETVELNDEENKFEETRIIVLAGLTLQYLTQKKMRGMKHTVVTSPLLPGAKYSRDSITINASRHFDSNLIPLNGDHKEQLQDTYENYGSFFLRYSNKYSSAIDTCAVKTIPDVLLEYPKEEEMTCEETDQGPVYVRRALSGH